MDERADDIIVVLDDYTITMKRDKAILLEHIDGDETWLPLSQIILDEDGGTIRVPLWLAKKKGMA